MLRIVTFMLFFIKKCQFSLLCFARLTILCFLFGVLLLVTMDKNRKPALVVMTESRLFAKLN